MAVDVQYPEESLHSEALKSRARRGCDGGGENAVIPEECGKRQNIPERVV